jgi:hypothetical protein
MTSSSEPYRRTAYWTDDSGIVHRTIWIRCSKCILEFLEEDYEEHIKICRGPQIPPKTSSESRDVNFDLPYPVGHGLYQCPHCPAKVRANKVLRHLWNAHRKTLPSPKSSSTQIGGKSKKGTLVVCPKCGAKVRPNRLKRHLSKVHNKIQVEQNHPVDEATKRMTVCTECGIKVRLDRLKNHQIKAHSTEQEEKKSTTQKTKNELTTCPDCNVKVRKDRLRRHYNKVHRGDKASRQADENQSGKRTSSHIREAFNQSFDEPRDGSKHWGTMRREHGRFGSHPIFDDYGDESNP